MTDLRVVLLGPPGSGKGTQGRRLAQRHDLLLLSTGEALRQAVEARTHLGSEVKSSLEAGDLVPDPLVIRMVLLRLEENRREAAPRLATTCSSTLLHANAWCEIADSRPKLRYGNV